MDAPPAAAPKPCCVCAAPNGKHCAKCKSRHYCSKACQLVDWKGGHNKACKQMTAEFQDRLLDELMPAKKPKEAPAVVDDVLLEDSSKAAARLSAVGPTALVKANALNDDTPSWRGTCAICLDLLPLQSGRRTFYECCCKEICTACFVKCEQHDERCPLCRAPAATSDADWLRRLQKHVDKGHAEAQLQLGARYHEGMHGLKKSPKRAFQLYELAAAQGHPKGQVNLGCCYQTGLNVKINNETAVQWFRRAAEQAFPQAQANLGSAFYSGKGVAQSFDEAVRWWRLAAAQGEPYALANLGLCYARGHGVPQDDDEALHFYKRAAAKGHAGAMALAARASG